MGKLFSGKNKWMVSEAATTTFVVAAASTSQPLFVLRRPACMKCYLIFKASEFPSNYTMNFSRVTYHLEKLLSLSFSLSLALALALIHFCLIQLANDIFRVFSNDELFQPISLNSFRSHLYVRFIFFSLCLLVCSSFNLIQNVIDRMIHTVRLAEFKTTAYQFQDSNENISNAVIYK